MLGKLLKHEWKETARPMLAMYLIFTVITAMGAVMGGLGLLEKMNFISSIFILLYVISICSLLLLTAVYLTLRFYQTMYARRGYLTHTLPVSPGAVLHAKILTTLLWMCLSFLMCILSFIALSIGMYGIPSAAAISEFGKEISTVFGMSPALSMGLLFILFACFCFYMTMLVFSSLSVGQLFQQNRIPAAIVFGILLYIIGQATSAVILLVSGIDGMENMEPATHAAQISAFVRQIISLSAIQMLLLGLIYYGICRFISSKKLNLE